ncbi:MAG: hypothetical protein ACFUZC_04100 [Chthoniobacteraceae bacterium]
MEDLYLPPQRIPFQLFYSIGKAGNLQVGKQFPVHWLPTFRRSDFLGINDIQCESRIAIFLSYRRQDLNMTVFNLQQRLGWATVSGFQFQTMHSFYGGIFHLIGNGMSAIPGKHVNAGSHQKVR